MDNSSATHFLNVDLEIYSRYDLQPLVDSFGSKVFVLHAGRHKRTFCAKFELANATKSLDSTIREFCTLIRALPTQDRKMWDAAKSRDFSIGIRAGTHPNPCDFAIEAETLNAVTELAGRIVLSIYPFEDEASEIEVIHPVTGG